jgi:hypothetical protein
MVREPPSQCTLFLISAPALQRRIMLISLRTRPIVSTASCSKLFVRPSLQQAVQHCFNDHHQRFKNTEALVPQ